MVDCLKLKALKLIDRALAINNIPIIEGKTISSFSSFQIRRTDLRITRVKA